MKHIKVVFGDITKATEDCIVNAANPKMLGGGGVDGAIHKAAGSKLLEACRKVKSIDGIRCPFGESRITDAGNLNAKFVIHSVGPIYRNEDNPEAVLHSAYRSACELALKNQCQSIAFPALSCGAYGYPHEKAARIALETCAKYPSLRIVFFIYDKSLLDVFSREYKKVVS